MRLSSIFLVALPLAVARASPNPHKVKERVLVPRGWIRQSSPPPPEAVIPLRFALPQARFDQLEEHLYAVSDPDHERYGAHLSKADVEALVAPHPASLDAVNKWLESFGIPEDALHRSPAKDWVTVHVPVALAEEMLDTRFYVWKHATDGNTLLRTLSYSLPEHVYDHIELVHPTTYFNRAKPLKTTFRFSQPALDSSGSSDVSSRIQIPNSNITVDPSCNKTITVTCLKELYNAVDYVPTKTKVNQIGITGYLEEFANFEDLQLFYADQVPKAVNSSFEVKLINGGQNNQSASEAGVEANLDVQFAFGLTFPTPGTFWSTGGSPPFKPDAHTPNNTNEPYSEWLDFILAQDVIPQTISTSYADDEQSVPENFAKRVCAGFAQLGARGVSLLFGSGDGGVGDGDADPNTQLCQTNDGRNKTVFLPLFPASCPYITSVGGTENIPEIAVFFSGGGFSNYFSRPKYQDNVVPKYLASLAPGTYAGLFNPKGRAIPDVAAQAERFRVFVSGRPISVGGTSAATPTFAGIVSLLNDARFARGLAPLGFLNPLIYSPRVSSSFNDITIGNNPGCGTPGFNATIGWDPITGFGTPDFEKLKDIVAP